MAKRRNEKDQFRPRNRAYRGRPVGERSERQRILIICGGQTEAWYFDNFRAIVRPLKLVVRADGVDPKRLIARAEKIKVAEAINGDFDAVWCIFDCDDFGVRYDQAHADAERAGFRVAASNPCFELWFVLHFREVLQPLSTADCQKLMETLRKKSYCKTDAALFGELHPHLGVAMERATKLQSQHERAGTPAALPNPSTTVHLLLQSLQQNGLR